MSDFAAVKRTTSWFLRLESGLRYNGNAQDFGAQTERRGRTGEGPGRLGNLTGRLAPHGAAHAVLTGRHFPVRIPAPICPEKKEKVVTRRQETHLGGAGPLPSSLATAGSNSAPRTSSCIRQRVRGPMTAPSAQARRPSAGAWRGR